MMKIAERVTDLSASELVGDLLAEPGSRHWCIGMRFEIQKLLDNHQRDHESLQTCVAYFIEQRGWEKLQDARKRPFGSYTDFCKARKPHGLGRAPEEIDQIIAEGKDRQKQAAVDAARANPNPLLPVGSNQHSEGVPKNKKGTPSRGSNKASTRVRKLRRDAPEVVKRLEAGEFKSVAAAERAARGEEPHPPRKVPTPLDLGKKAWAKMSKAERKKFLAWLDTPEAQG